MTIVIELSLTLLLRTDDSLSKVKAHYVLCTQNYM